MNKRILYVICAIVLSNSILLSCTSSCNFQDVREITVYYMEPCWCLELDGNPEYSSYCNLIDEDDIRCGAEYIIEIPGGTKKANSFLQKLFSASKVNAIDNKVKCKKINGIEYFWQDGIVIDVFYKDAAKEKDVYIMKNGEKIFYKKGEENIYYKMPWQIRIKSFWRE